MKVYAAVYEYDEVAVLGVYESLERAKQACQRNETDNANSEPLKWDGNTALDGSGFYNYRIWESVLGQDSW
jgi:hypothetical protein